MGLLKYEKTIQKNVWSRKQKYESRRTRYDGLPNIK
jgi:hypothetical protein